MSQDMPHLPVHPAGDQPAIVQDTALAPATLDTWAGPVRVEWDPTAPLTPYGQLPFFIEFLKVAGLFDAAVADCPLAYTSPNAPDKRDVLGTTKIKHAASGQEIDFGGEWREVKYKDLIIEATGDAAWFSRSKAEKIARAEALGLTIAPAWEDFEVTNEIFSKKIEPTLIQPTFVVNLPKELCPLAKINRDDPTTLDVFELTISGMEIAPAYSEQNDPDVQRQMFEAQAGEEKQNIDHDFLLALEHGMPPAGGMGVGIDRLCILLTGAESIRDVILFPQLRPEGAAKS